MRMLVHALILGMFGCASHVNTNPIPDPAKPLPVATVGKSYAYQFRGSDKKATYKIGRGSLPPGLVLNPSGMLSGVPQQKGTYSFTVTTSSGTLVSEVFANLQ